MKPLEHVKDKNYYGRPTEQRARGIAALTDMEKMGYSIDDVTHYLDNPMEKLDKNTQDLLNNFGKEQTAKFLKVIYALGIPIGSTTYLSKNKK